ncbi:hypothetical protein Tco_1355352 [Tanacetum coccineum]
MRFLKIHWIIWRLKDNSRCGELRDVVMNDKEKVMLKSKVSTDKEKDSTDRTDEGTDDQTEGRRATQTIQTTQTTTSTMFGDDETIAQVLLNMSQAKAVSSEKEKRKEVSEAEKKFSNLSSDEEMARKLQDDLGKQRRREDLAEEDRVAAEDG